MFTGIIEEIGTMQRIAKQGQAMVLTIEASKVTEDVHLGDSIAVNGVCLTVIAFSRTSITVDVMPETFRRTTLKALNPGSAVNLERAMAAGGRFGGHIVQGHVDAVGTVRERLNDENAVVFRIEPDEPAVMRYIVSKGSITIDGISLTVVDVTDRDFTVSIIPHTLAETVLKHRVPGSMVNLETDIIGKYVERLLQSGYSTPPAAPAKNTLTERFLAEHGFLG